MFLLSKPSYNLRADIRIYDGKSGKLIKVFTDLMQALNGIELIDFCCDNKNRKLYLNDINGIISIYNANNGLYIKTVGKNIRNNKCESKEVTGLFYDSENQNVIASYNDSCIRVYDDTMNIETPKLREILGGHGGSPITFLDYSSLLGLIATGSASGTITVWDYEMSRIEGQCHLHTKEIISLKFMQPYPILISSSYDGFI